MRHKHALKDLQGRRHVKCNMYQGVTSLARMHAQVHSSMGRGCDMHGYCTTGLFGVKYCTWWLEHPCLVVVVVVLCMLSLWLSLNLYMCVFPTHPPLSLCGSLSKILYNLIALVDTEGCSNLKLLIMGLCK